MMKQDQALLKTKPVTLNSIYDSYGGMLLGYIFEIVKDHEVAENYLVKIFKNMATQLNDRHWGETNMWCQLQRLAKTELASFYNAEQGCENPVKNTAAIHGSPNKYLDLMSDEQKQIFCNFYYNKKTTAQLSTQLNKPEELIRKLLKEAFAILKGTP